MLRILADVELCEAKSGEQGTGVLKVFLRNAATRDITLLEPAQKDVQCNAVA